MFQETQDINCAFVFYLLQHTVYHDVGTSSADTSAIEDIRETHVMQPDPSKCSQQQNRTSKYSCSQSFTSMLTPTVKVSKQNTLFSWELYQVCISRSDTWLPCLHCCCCWRWLGEAIQRSTLRHTAAIPDHQGCSRLWVCPGRLQP